MSKKNYFANPMLIGAMELVKKNKTPQNLKVFMDELKHAKLISPIIISPTPELDENGKAIMTPESKISIPMLPGSNEKKYLIAFTDREEFKKVFPDGSFNILPFGVKDYDVMIAQTEDSCDGFVINPGTDGVIVNKSMIAAIIDSLVKKSEEPTTEE